MNAFRYIPHSIMQSERHEQISAVVYAALQAADPAAAVQRSVRRDGNLLFVGQTSYDLDAARRVLVIGVGKAVLAMAAGMAAVLGDRLDGGLLISKHALGQEDPSLPSSLTVIVGEHPVPGEGSLEATRALVALLRDCHADDLIFCLISGGGSALMTLPQHDVPLGDLQALTKLLLASGATISEINCLRKHLDQIKGGGLARIAHPATLVTLVLSDVVGSPLSAIASGPTVADPSTYADALAVLERYGLGEQVPGGIRWALEEGQLGFRPETVKPGDPLLEKKQTVLVGSNEQSARAAVEEARRQGFSSILLSSYVQGEARQVGELLGGILRQAATSGDPLSRPACLVAGGETTVVLRGGGFGGRNLELALGAVEMAAGLERALLVSLATDGEDGPTDAAGAVVSGETRERALTVGMSTAEYLRENNAYPFFELLDDLILTGPTGTNVNDLIFLFSW